MDLNKRKIILLLLLASVIIAMMIIGPRGREQEEVRGNGLTYQALQGQVFGTFYHIKYGAESNINLKDEIESEFAKFNKSLSTFDSASVISRVNKGDTSVVADSFFICVFNKGMEISVLTNGAFDMTVAPLVNALGFGFKPNRDTKDTTIERLRKSVGYNKIKLLPDGKIEKEDEGVMLDASAIAKGYASDVIARLLERNGVENYMVEIGGEVVTKGVNDKGFVWTIGINKPVEDSTMVGHGFQCVIKLDNSALATSGNYLQYYYKDGKKFSHTIDPRTAQPVNHSLLSATVIAKDCMTADALATSCMVLGLDSAMALIDGIKDVEAYFIYSGENGEYLEKHTKGFEQGETDKE